MPYATVYESFDIEERVDGVTYLGDAQDMSAIASAQYDALLASELLEHLPCPEAALSEFARVMRPGGVLILTVPFLSRLHEEPHDYFRYTEHGLRLLLRRHGFLVGEIVPIGSVFGFVGHQISSALVIGTWRLPIVRELVWLLNGALVVLPCRLLDKLSGLSRKLPAGYVVVARRHVPTS
jgi:SAM-dependent methyltransferase